MSYIITYAACCGVMGPHKYCEKKGNEKQMLKDKARLAKMGYSIIDYKMVGGKK